MLDDFTENNGATRLVPKSHLIPGSVQDHMKDPNDRHPDEILLLAPAGSVMVYNSHVWHGGTLNKSQKTRRSLHAYYLAKDNDKDHFQSTNQLEYLRKTTYDRLSPAPRYLLNIE